MRLALSGGIPHPRTIALDLEDDSIFRPRDFEGYGYNFFQLICVGGGGGAGGSWHKDYDDGGRSFEWRALGGSGGGGGLHRVSGPLQSLPNACAVKVGQGGAHGLVGSMPDDVTNGSHGHMSSFNDNTCFASGGMGGQAPNYVYSDGGFSPSPTSPAAADGGEGGRGNREDPGGGAAGGQARPTLDATHPSAGSPGEFTYETGIGEGGGGGVGGLARAGRIWTPASAGGAGSYNAISDPDRLSCPGGYPGIDQAVTHERILPGRAGGGDLIGFTFLARLAGRSFGETRDGEDGCVVIVLSMV